MSKSEYLSAAWDALKEAAIVIAAASTAVHLLTPIIGEENVQAAYRAMLGAYLVVRLWLLAAQVRKELQEGGE